MSRDHSRGTDPENLGSNKAEGLLDIYSAFQFLFWAHADLTPEQFFVVMGAEQG